VPPDSNIVSCDVNALNATSITNDGIGNWTAAFDNVPVSAPDTVPLTVTGDHGGRCRISITVGGPALGTSCIVLEGKPGLKPEYMLRIWVKRQDPPEPGGFALQLKFKGTPRAEFLVGGKLPTAITECHVGLHKAAIVKQGEEWYAPFQNVPPGDYDLTARAGLRVIDQVRIRIVI
jgi:hypothetical protein